MNISITGNGVVDNVGPIEKVKKVKRVDFPVKDYLEQYYDKNFYLSIEEYFGAFEELEIPFLDNPVFSFGRDFFSLKNLIETIDNYDRFVLYATTEATELKEGVEGGKIKIVAIHANPVIFIILAFFYFFISLFVIYNFFRFFHSSTSIAFISCLIIKIIA